METLQRLLGVNGEEILPLIFIFLLGMIGSMAAFGIGLGSYLGSKKMMRVNAVWEKLTTRKKKEEVSDNVHIENESKRRESKEVPEKSKRTKPDVQEVPKKKKPLPSETVKERINDNKQEDDEHCYSYCDYYAKFGECFEDCEMEQNQQLEGQETFDSIDNKMKACTAYNGETKDTKVYCKVFGKVGICFSECPMALK